MNNIIIECLHVDDEMWSVKTAAAWTIRSLFREAVGDGEPWDEPKPPGGVEIVTLDPLPLRDEFHLDGVVPTLQLTQTSSFREAERLIDDRFYQLVIADAVDEKAGESTNELAFLSYSGCKLLRKARDCSEQRLIYSKDYFDMYDRHEVDLVAGELGAFVTDHPISMADRAQFLDRFRRMARAALLNPVMGGCRAFARLTQSNNDQVGLEILEHADGRWRILVHRLPLIGVTQGGRPYPGPAFAECATFLWYLGYSRGRLLSHRDFLMPRALPGTGSWVRALTTIYKKFVDHRNTTLFPDELAFRAMIDSEVGFWPGSLRWSKGQKRAGERDRIPWLRLNLLTPVPSVQRYWMPEYKNDRVKEGMPNRYFKPFTREIIRSVLPYLPGGGSGQDTIFPLSDKWAFDD